MIDFPIFSGNSDEDPVEWLEAFTRACVGNNIGENRRLAIVPNFLRGNALSWYNQNKTHFVHQKSNVQTTRFFTHLFEQKFQDPFKVSQWHYTLRSRKQKPGETVDAYNSALDELQRRVDPNRNYPEVDKIRQFIDGLHQEFQIPVQSESPTTLNQAVNKARAIEVAYSKGSALSAYSFLPTSSQL